jgi:hypothetical protein
LDGVVEGYGGELLDVPFSEIEVECMVAVEMVKWAGSVKSTLV